MSMIHTGIAMWVAHCFKRMSSIGRCAMPLLPLRPKSLSHYAPVSINARDLTAGEFEWDMSPKSPAGGVIEVR